MYHPTKWETGSIAQPGNCLAQQRSRLLPVTAKFCHCSRSSDKSCVETCPQSKNQEQAENSKMSRILQKWTAH
jgi:hypothetical protein